MEGLKVRSLAVGGLLIVGGLALQAMPKANLTAKDEKFMEAKAPMRAGKFKFEGTMDNPVQSYKVDQSTYDILKPFGIVGRHYSDGHITYDVMLISGNDKNSFHDNRVCFQAQNYTITGQEIENVETPRGSIPVTFLTLQHMERGKLMAAMFYKGPQDKWFPLPQQLTWEMFKEQLRLGKNLDSTFYRIIPLIGEPSREEFKQFIKDYVVAAKESSGGFF